MITRSFLIGWFCIILATIYSANGQDFAFFSFTIFGALSLIFDIFVDHPVAKKHADEQAARDEQMRRALEKLERADADRNGKVIF